MSDPFEIFVVCPPGLEPMLVQEMAQAGFPGVKQTSGGAVFEGDWADVWRANLMLRGATRVLARIGSFMAFHLAQLDKRARKFDWTAVLDPGVPVRVEVATSRRSKIYHAGAATQRIETALKETCGIQIAQDAPVAIKARIDDNKVTISIDTSGDSLHKRGHKQAVNTAPLRETLAALFLRNCGYSGAEPVLDPMCGSGTFVIEAAEIALGLAPGRSRSFAFEHLANFNWDAWTKLRDMTPTAGTTPHRFHGRDRDAGAIKMSLENAARAGVDSQCDFATAAISDLTRPEGPPGLVICNPPYGGRIGQQKALYGLYGAFGQVMRDRFAGWRVGIITTDAGLAKATGLPFDAPRAPVPHGGLKVRLFQTKPLI